LAVDRLGHGTNPQHPDPFDVVQRPLQIELLHQLVRLLRAGIPSAGPPAFADVAWIGHSCGSTPGSHLAATHPNS